MSWLSDAKKNMRIDPVQERKNRLKLLAEIAVNEIKKSVENGIRYPERYPQKLNHCFGDSVYEGYRLYEKKEKSNGSLLRDKVRPSEAAEICDMIKDELKELGFRHFKVKPEPGVDIESRHKNFFGRYVYKAKGVTIRIVLDFR